MGRPGCDAVERLSVVAAGGKGGNEDENEKGVGSCSSGVEGHREAVPSEGRHEGFTWILAALDPLP